MLDLRVLAASLIGITMASCSPQCNIAGAYFPAWLACAIGAFMVTWLAHWIGSRLGITPHLQPAVLVYPSLFVAIACAIWLICFAVS
jgi:YtcA family